MKIHDIEFREVDRARFEEVRSGLKSVETRAVNEKYESIEEGDEIRFICGQDSFSKKVRKIYYWPTIEAMLAEMPVAKMMPGLVTVEEVRKRYATYPGYLEKIAEKGIQGFELA